MAERHLRKRFVVAASFYCAFDLFDAGSKKEIFAGARDKVLKHFLKIHRLCSTVVQFLIGHSSGHRVKQRRQRLMFCCRFTPDADKNLRFA